MLRRALDVLLLVLATAFAAHGGEVTFGGVVLDAQGRPIKGASVEVVRPPSAFEEARLGGRDTRKPSSSAFSDARGRYRVQVPEAGMWRVAVRAPGFIPQQVRFLMIPASLEGEEVRLVAATPLRVAIVDEQGRPIAGARLRVSSSQEDMAATRVGQNWQSMPRFARTGVDGTATIPIGDREDVHLAAIAPGFSETEFKNPNEGPVRVRLNHGCQRSLRVVDSQLQPAAGVLVQFHRWRLGKTDAAGGVKIDVFCDREMGLRFAAPDGRPAVKALRPAAGQTVEAELVLPPAVRLSGMVLEKGSRKPLAGAPVWPEDDPAFFTLSDRQGRYTVLKPARKDAWLAATTNGVEVARGMSVSGAGPTLYLSPTISISGLLTDEVGKPVAGAGVELSETSSWSKARTRSDAKGAFGLRVAAGHPYRLVIYHSGFLPREVFSRNESERALKIVLERGKIAEAVIEDETGLPLAGAEGFLSPDDETMRKYPFDELRRVRAVADRSGRLRFTGLPAGRFALLLRAAGRTPMTVAGQEIHSAGKVTELGTFRFPPAAKIEGFVIDERNQPIQGALVRRDSDPDFAGVRTDADGCFVITGPSGAEVDLTVVKSGFGAGSLKKVVAPTREPVTIALQPAYRTSHVSGWVHDEKGEPIAGAFLDVLPPSIRGAMQVSSSVTFMRPYAYAGEDGSFSFDFSEPGMFALTATASGYLSKQVDFEVAEGQRIDGLDMVLSVGTATLLGRVTGPDGEPVPGLPLSLWHRESKNAAAPGLNPIPVTDSDGSYRIGGLAEGLWNLQLAQRPFLAVNRELELHAGENRLDVQLQLASEIEGQVTDESGRPAQGVTFILSSPEAPAESGGFIPNGMSDENGHFAIAGIQPGQYGIQTEKSGFARSEPVPLDLSRSSVRGLRLIVYRGGTIRGRVLGLNARELQRLKVHAHRPPGWTKEAQIDARGEYQIQGLESGEWTISAWTSTRKAEAPVLLAAGATELAPDLTFQPGVTLTVRILRQGKPVPNLLVQAMGPSYAILEASALGEVRFEDLYPGTYKIRILSSPLKWSHESPLLEQEIEVPGDRYVVIELPATPDGD